MPGLDVAFDPCLFALILLVAREIGGDQLSCCARARGSLGEIVCVL